MSNNLEVALTKEKCFGCLAEMDGSIIMNQKLTPKHAKEVARLHGKVVGFSEYLCDECKIHTETGVILIGYDEDKTDDLKNPYRNGFFIVIKKEAFTRIFNQDIPEKGIALVENKIGIEIGLWEVAKLKDTIDNSKN